MKALGILFLLVALSLSLASTSVEASSWLPWMGASVNAGITTTQYKASAYLAWNLSFCGESAQTWSNAMPEQLLNIPTGLYGVSVDVAVAPFIDVGDGRQSFKQVWVSQFVLRDNIGPKNSLLCPTAWDPSRGFTYTFVPRDCSGDVKYLWVYAEVGGAKRKENGLFIPIFSNIFPNALTMVSHSDGFQLIGVIQYTTSRWTGAPPRDAAELGNFITRHASSGGVSTHTYENLAQQSYEDAMQVQPSSGDYKIAFYYGDTPYSGIVSKIVISADNGQSFMAGREKRGPVLTMGDTTPGTYHYWFQFPDGSVADGDYAVSPGALLRVQVPIRRR